MFSNAQSYPERKVTIRSPSTTDDKRVSFQVLLPRLYHQYL
jgi:hypothetical protein